VVPEPGQANTSMNSQWGKQYRYAHLYSQPLPSDRRSFLRPVLLGAAGLTLLSGLIWFVFFGPGFNALFGISDTPSISNSSVTLNLAGQRFFIPKNYLRRVEQRRSGDVDQIEIQALLPDLAGFSEETAEDFADKSNTSRVIYITLTAPKQVMRPAERFYQIYPYYFSGPERQGEYGLRLRNMDKNSGFSDFDILYNQVDNRFFLYHCLKAQNDLMPPDCLADKVVEPKILARFRFRRTALADWKNIDSAVETLLSKFAGR